MSEKEKDQETAPGTPEANTETNKGAETPKGGVFDILLDMIDKLCDPDKLDIVASRAKETKRIIMEEEIETGDMIILSSKSSPAMKRYRDREMKVRSVDRDGRIYVQLDGIDTLLSREKVLLVRKG